VEKKSCQEGAMNMRLLHLKSKALSDDGIVRNKQRGEELRISGRSNTQPRTMEEQPMEAAPERKLEAEEESGVPAGCRPGADREKKTKERRKKKHLGTTKSNKAKKDAGPLRTSHQLHKKNRKINPKGDRRSNTEKATTKNINRKKKAELQKRRTKRGT